MTTDNDKKRLWRGIVGGALLILSVTGAAQTARDDLAAGRISDVLNTKHNFAAGFEPELPNGDTRLVKASDENQTCIFCHTPHGKPANDPGFLWNRNLDVGPYTLYGSTSMDATPGQPGLKSKMCLSCHDGTLALSTLAVYTDTSVQPSRTEIDATVPMVGLASDGTMPAGVGVDSGYTRDLGTDLSNDHPIGFTYDSTLASADGELVDPDTVDYLGPRVGAGPVQRNQGLGQAGAPADAPFQTATRLAAPLEPTQNVWQDDDTTYARLLTGGALECTTCHDPHLRSSDNSINIKFLRLNRIQKAQPAATFDKDRDINCLACHQKAGWPRSVHAHAQVADEVYSDEEMDRQELPRGTQVWETACTACHDPHTVAGAPRLLREGTDDTNVPKQGGNAASEATCYQCHGARGAQVLKDTAQVVDIEAEFGKAAAHPIQVAQAGNEAQEVHQVVDADLLEPAAQLGGGGGSERHVECADCHHPHRMIKNPRFNDDPTQPDSAGTHRHQAGQLHDNVASGALRGIWGVEPSYSTDAFDPNALITFEVKKGDPGTGATTDVSNTFVTREYQVCLKCHSAYANGPNKTDQALEFQAPATHQGEASANHRSWHPVIGATGRDSASRANADPELWLAPWNTSGALGSQTMYCSDCHASDGGTVAGPHGANNPGLLIGPWDGNTGGPSGGTQDLCFACHDYDQYANPAVDPTTLKRSGFSCAADTCITATADKPYFVNLHAYHAARNVGTAGSGTGARCMDCHTALPHGWKNKALLVDLNNVGSEFGRADQAVAAPYTELPYYDQARLQVTTFQLSGQWDKASCGASGGCHQ